MRITVAVFIAGLVACTFATSTQDQILALLQTGTKSHDAIDAVFGLLNDLKQSNIDTQFAADKKNETDELIGASTVSSFTQVMNLNKKLVTQSAENRQRFEQELQDTKNYLAWNEARRDQIVARTAQLEDNQCYSNQLFIRSIKANAEALEVVRLLKQDVSGYVTNGISMEFAEIPKDHVKSIASKLKQYSHLFNEHEINAFMQLANQNNEGEESEVAVAAPSKRTGTVAEKVLSILEDLEANLAASIDNLRRNEIAAAWELSAWLRSSAAEVQYLAEEYERKQIYADRTATQIQAALAQGAKSNAILRESQDALNQAIADLEAKRESYAEEKAKRDEENAILDEVISMFKNQVASWSGRF